MSTRPEQDPVVRLEGVSRRFGARTVLADLDLTVRKGELVGIIGPNGGGKSTLLMMMAGLVRPTRGKVTVCGVDAYALSLTAAGRVGLVTARPGLYPLLTGRENLHHFGGLFALPPRTVDERAQVIAKTLQLARLDDRVDQLSTGMQQKLSLIRALLTSPSVLLFDEPTANLDPIAARAFYAEIRKRADDGIACVLVTHELAAAEATCDRVLLVDGAIKRELTFPERRAPFTGPLFEAWQATLR